MATRHLLGVLSLSASCLATFLGCGSSGSGFGDSADGGAGPDAEGDAGSLSDGSPVFGDSGTGDGGPTGPLGDVEAVVTCDNAYGFGWGDMTKMDTYFTAPASDSAGDIFNCPLGYPTGANSGDGYGPEIYSIPSAQAPGNAYLYAIAWADESVTQGLLGQFKRSGAMPLYTGDAKWEVCATGLEYNSGIAAQKPGPTTAIVNEQIAVCNAGTGSKTTSSGGWVNTAGPVTAGAVGKLAVGQDNSAAYPVGGAFPIVCQTDTGPDGGTRQGIDAQAHWMWYSASGTGDAFHYVSEDASRQFLIFRLAAKDLPVPK